MRWKDWRLAAIFLLASVVGCSSGTSNNNSAAYLDTISGDAAVTTQTDASNKSSYSNDMSVQPSKDNEVHEVRPKD